MELAQRSSSGVVESPVRWALEVCRSGVVGVTGSPSLGQLWLSGSVPSLSLSFPVCHRWVGRVVRI